MLPSLDRWKKGDVFSAGHLNQAVDIARSLTHLGGNNGVSIVRGPNGSTISIEHPIQIVAWKLCQITNSTAGLGGGTDYNDNRYWLKDVYPAAAGQNSQWTGLNNDPPAKDDSNAYVEPYPFTGTNLAEYSGGTHYLEIGQPVQAFAVRDHQNPPVLHWFFSQNAFSEKVLRVVGYDAAKGYYNVKIQQRKNSGFSSSPNPADFSDDVDLKLTDYYTDGASAIAYNQAESGVGIPALVANGKEFITATLGGTVSDVSVPISGPLYKFNKPYQGIPVRIDHIKQNGIYTGVALWGPTGLLVTSDAAEINTSMTTGSVQCIIINTEEISVTGGNGPQAASGNRLAVGSYSIGEYMGMSSDATPVPVISLSRGVGRIGTPSDLVSGSFTGGTWGGNLNSWDWSNTSADTYAGTPVTYRFVDGVHYDGSTNAAGTAVTAGGAHELVFPRRKILVDARGVHSNIGGEESVGTVTSITLKPITVGVASMSGTTLQWTPQVIYVIDYDAPGTTVNLMTGCS